jgi:hypothetical protein
MSNFGVYVGRAIVLFLRIWVAPNCCPEGLYQKVIIAGIHCLSGKLLWKVQLFLTYDSPHPPRSRGRRPGAVQPLGCAGLERPLPLDGKRVKGEGGGVGEGVL